MHPPSHRALASLGTTLLLASAACSDDGGASTQGNVTATMQTSTDASTASTTSTTDGPPTTDTPTTGNSATGTTSTDTTGTTALTATTTVATTDAPMTVTSETSTSDATTSTSSTTSTSTGPDDCVDGTIVCDGNTAKTCDGQGGFSDEQNCDPGVCIDGKGCLACVPGEAQCNGSNSEVCNEDGTGFDIVVCDAVQDVTCDGNSGQCVGDCAPGTLGLSYIGCEYYPTVTANVVTNNFNFAIVVANASNKVADIRIDRGANIVAQDSVNAGAVKVINLPWVPELKGTDTTPTTKAVDGAYRVRSTAPVTVYQYDPVEYTQGNFTFSYSNDASLLLPVNTWTGDYWVVSRNVWRFDQGTQLYPGFYAVTAAHDGTTVTLAPSATGNIVKAGAGVAANGSGVITLDQGDVLEVYAGTNGGWAQNPNPIVSDLTGTHVTADKPIQVISGHVCTFVPYNIGYCDHLEESIPPWETLAKDIIVTPPLIPTGGNTPKAQMVRIIATEPNTTLTYDPPQNGAPAMIASAGQYVELSQTTADFKISSNNKIMVAQYMLGQDAGGNSGDPAMALGVPLEQYRKKYLFHAPINYEKNYVNITAPMGAAVTLDGAAVNPFTPIGGTGYGIARVALPNNVDGNHDISSDLPIGISVYGYGQYTSYWYPGGLDLAVIPQ